MDPTTDLVASLLAGASNVPSEPEDEELSADPTESEEEAAAEEDAEEESGQEIPSVEDLKKQILAELRAQEPQEDEEELLPRLEMPILSRYDTQRLLDKVSVDQDRLASDPGYVIEVMAGMINNALALDSARQIEAMQRVARYTTNEERRQVSAGQKFWQKNSYLLEDLSSPEERDKRIAIVQRMAAGVQAENPSKSLAWIYEETSKNLAEIFKPQENERKKKQKRDEASRTLPKPGSSPRPKPGPKPSIQAMLAEQVLGGRAIPR